MWRCDGVGEEWECGSGMVLGSSGSVGVGWCWGAVGVWGWDGVGEEWGWDGVGEQWECGGVPGWHAFLLFQLKGCKRWSGE